MNKINSKNTHVWLICGIFGFDAIKNGFIDLIRKFIQMPYKIDTLFVYGIFSIVVIFSLNYVFKRTKFKDVVFAILFLVLLLTSYAMVLLKYGDYSNYYLKLLSQFFLCIASFLAFRASERNRLSDYIDALRITAFFITIGTAIVFFRGFGEKSYSQYFGYLALPATVISFDAVTALKGRKKRMHIFNFIVSFFLCVFSGTRGPVFCALIFIFLRILSANKRKNRLIAIVALLTMILFFIRYQNIIVDFLMVFAEENGFSTRLLRILQRTANSVSIQNRIMLAKLGIEALNENTVNSIVGFGIGIDRIVISKVLFVPDNDVIGYYPHNIFIEFIMQFGWLLGVALSSALIYVSIKAYNKSKDTISKNLFGILFSVGFLPLLFSDSYLSKPLFFCYLAECVNILEGSHRRIERHDRRMKTVVF